MPINSFLYPGAKFIPGYEVANSCRFNRADSADMTLSMSSGGSTTKFTKSFWVKRCAVGEQQYLFDNSGETQIFFKLDSGDTCTLGIYEGGYSTQLVSTQLFRDVSAWYNFIIAVDYTNATQAHRARVYVNGTEITAWGTETRPSNDSTTFDTWNSSKTHYLGSNASTNHYFNGYLAEVVHIDNAQLTPTSFGEFDSDSPTIWKPIDVSGLTFGTKGHYLDFEDSDNLGDDESGNTADWTEVNLDATDSATDTPTNNFCTLNPLEAVTATTTYAQGNMQGTTSNAARATFAVTNGKWYWEHKGVDSEVMGGVMAYDGFAPNDYTINALIGRFDGPNLVINGSEESGWADGTPDAMVDNDILQVALDCDNNRIAFGVNGAWYNATDGSGEWSGTTLNYFSISDGYYYSPAFRSGSGSNRESHFNFGGCPGFAITSSNADANGYGNFEFTVPSGFYSLCTKNLAEFG